MQVKKKETPQDLSLSKAAKLLPHGCRFQTLTNALRCGSLRGKKSGKGRRSWRIDPDDLHQWDESGRPVTPLDTSSANCDTTEVGVWSMPIRLTHLGPTGSGIGANYLMFIASGVQI